MQKRKNKTNSGDFPGKNDRNQLIFHPTDHLSDCTQTIHKLVEMGISAIPLAGKRPLSKLHWKQFQYRLPNANEITTWHRQDAISSYGIICGQVSGGIIVIDFDDPELYTDFIQTFPQFAQSYTVKTRRGYHVYLQTAFPVRSRSFNKCDIKGDGGYVVGAGSQIDGFIYQPLTNNPVANITYADLQSIIACLYADTPAERPQVHLHPEIDAQRLTLRYLQATAHMSRNQALYSVACSARHDGLSIETVVAELADLHSRTAVQGPHAPETQQERLKEAIRTITSAYKQTSPSNHNHKRGLANSIREAFLQQQASTVLARLLDAMRLENWSSQGYFTLAEAIQLGHRHHIGRRSILQALTGNLSQINGKRIFEQLAIGQMDTPVCQGDSREPNSKRGRKTLHVYQVPSDEDLYLLLDVRESLSDPLLKRDLYSASAYRQALHRELILRLSPSIKVDWYAQRLGVHRRTIFRYNRGLGVRVSPTITYERLTAELAHTLPERQQLSDNLTPGTWLQTHSGKRYPAYQSTAYDVLAGHEGSILLCKQLPSRYEFLSEKQTVIASDIPYPIRRRGTVLTQNNIREIMPPDWAVKKYELGGYLAIFDGLDWQFRPPLQSIAYQLVKHYDDGLVYFVRSRYV